MFKAPCIAAALALALGSAAQAEEVRHPTADEFSRLSIAGMKHGLAQSHPAMKSCVDKISNYAYSEAYQAIIARIVPAADRVVLDAFFSTPLGARWTDDNILYSRTGGASHGEFDAEELERIRAIVSMPSYIKLQEVGGSGDPLIQKAMMKALDPCQ